MVEVDPEHFAQWEAAEQRVVQLQGELTRSKKTNTVTSTQPSKTIHEAFATYGNHAQDAPQALPREQLQQLVRALKEASKGPDTSGPSPTESSQAALQSQIDNLAKCVLENCVVVEGVHTRLLKLEGRVEEMDMAKGKAVSENMRQELKTVKTAVYVIGNRLLNVKAAGEGKAAQTDQGAVTAPAKKRKRGKDDVPDAEMPSSPPTRRPMRKSSGAVGKKGAKKKPVAPVSATNAILEAVEDDGEDDARESLLNAKKARRQRTS